MEGFFLKFFLKKLDTKTFLNLSINYDPINYDHNLRKIQNLIHSNLTRSFLELAEVKIRRYSESCIFSIEINHDTDFIDSNLKKFLKKLYMGISHTTVLNLPIVLFNYKSYLKEEFRIIEDTSGCVITVDILGSNKNNELEFYEPDGQSLSVNIDNDDINTDSDDNNSKSDNEKGIISSSPEFDYSNINLEDNNLPINLNENDLVQNIEQNIKLYNKDIQKYNIERLSDSYLSEKFDEYLNDPTKLEIFITGLPRETAVARLKILKLIESLFDKDLKYHTKVIHKTNRIEDIVNISEKNNEFNSYFINTIYFASRIDNPILLYHKTPPEPFKFLKSIFVDTLKLIYIITFRKEEFEDILSLSGCLLKIKEIGEDYSEAQLFVNSSPKKDLINRIMSIFESIYKLSLPNIYLKTANILFITNNENSLCIVHKEFIKNVFDEIEKKGELQNQNPDSNGFSLQMILNNSLADFLCGKKNGKVNRITKETGARIHVQNIERNSIKEENCNNHELLNPDYVITLLSNSPKTLSNALFLLSMEFPSSLTFYLPEKYHKRIIGFGGKNIQRIMKKHGVYIKFFSVWEKTNSYSDFINDFISDDMGNVVIKTPLKNYKSLFLMKKEILSLVDEEFVQEKQIFRMSLFEFYRFTNYTGSVKLGWKEVFLDDAKVWIEEDFYQSSQYLPENKNKKEFNTINIQDELEKSIEYSNKSPDKIFIDKTFKKHLSQFEEGDLDEIIEIFGDSKNEPENLGTNLSKSEKNDILSIENLSIENLNTDSKITIYQNSNIKKYESDIMSIHKNPIFLINSKKQLFVSYYKTTEKQNHYCHTIRLKDGTLFLRSFDKIFPNKVSLFDWKRIDLKVFESKLFVIEKGRENKWCVGRERGKRKQR